MGNNRKLMVARLAAAYRQGRLVPFLGARMSAPACPGWEDFIIGLERQAFGRKQPRKTGLNRSEEQIRRANAAVRHFRLRGESDLYKAVQDAEACCSRKHAIRSKMIMRRWLCVLFRFRHSIMLSTNPHVVIE